MVQDFKELRSDENDPLFDKTNMLKKEFPSYAREMIVVKDRINVTL